MQKHRLGTKHLLTVAMLSCICSPTAFARDGQTVTINQSGVTLKSLFQAIEDQTSYRISYQSDVVNDSQTVNANYTNVAVTDLLKSALAEKNLAFRVVSNNSIAIIPQDRADNKAQKTIDITGRVFDAAGEPIIGANVVVNNSTIATATDYDGRFSLRHVPAGATLTVTYIGYISQTLRADNAKAIANIRLKENTEVLDEVVVVGYGTQSSKLVTTSISKLKMEDVDKGSNNNPIKMLQGRVAGVNISTSSGTPGSNPAIQVRGVGSVSGSSTPLYVVDGIPAETYPNINSEDIESIEVLKDASAAAIYGSRANSGVVIITTKSGVSGKTKVDVSGYYGFGKIASDIEMANSTEYINTMQAAVDNYNVQTGSNLSFYIPSTIEETNWVDVISRNSSKYANANLAVSGGNDKTNFYTSLSYNSQEGYLLKSKVDQYNLRAKFSHKINNIFKLNMNMAGAHTRYNQLEETSTSLKVLRTAREEQPWYSPYREDGSYKVMGTELTRHNALMLINEETKILDKYHLSGIFSVDVTPFKGFKYTPTVSMYSILDNTDQKLTEKHDARKNNSGWAAVAEQKDQSFRYVIDNIFSYNNDWKKLTYSAMLGHSFEKYAYECFGAKSDNYANEAFPSSSFGLITSGTAIYAGTVSYTSYALESYFGRIALNWDNRYILNASLRRDGSSRFAKSSRYGSFPSLSFAWRMMNEDFMPKDGIVNDAKLRLSWGVTGSQAGIGNYDTMSLITSGGSGYNGSSSFQIGQDGQPLKWEKAHQYNIGFDLDFFNSRLTANVDMFYQRTNDLLYSKPTIQTAGVSSVTANIGSLDNKGIELAVNGDIFRGDFTWNLGANFSYVKNKLINLVDGVDMFTQTGSNLVGGAVHALIMGQPISTWYMLRMDGIYQRDDEVPEKLYAKGVRAGDVKYYDANGDGDISADDRINCGKATPDWFGGITSTMNYKGFDLNIFCQYSVGGKILAAWKGINGEGIENLGGAYTAVSATGSNDYFNVSKKAANGYWRGEGTSNSIPRPILSAAHSGYTVDYNVQPSTRYLEDASYFKLKTITLGYTLPQNLIRKARIQSARVYFTADNVLTFTKYDGYDPEATYSTSPSNANFGCDFGLQPVLRTFLWGINLTF